MNRLIFSESKAPGAVPSPYRTGNFMTVAVLLLIMTVLFSCRDRGTQPGQTPAKSAPVVRTQPVLNEKLVNSIEITGTLEANIISDITSPANGVIEMLAARENQRVEKGRIIAIINPDDRVSLISSNQLKVEQLERRLASSDESSSEYELIAADLEAAKIDLDFAAEMYQTIPVICPMTGIVTSRWLDEGSQVGSREKILTISDMNSLVVKAEVNEKYFTSIKQGNRLPVILNAYPGDSLTGVISLVYPQVDPVTRAVKFDMRILNFKGKLVPGMMATIKIPVSVIENALTVPEEAVLTSPENLNFLFVTDGDSIARRRVVKKGIISGNRLEIADGINQTDMVVVSGQEMLKEGMKVRIIK